MAEPATKPARRRLAAEAEAQGAIPVAPSEPEEEAPTETEVQPSTDIVHIEGVFDGYNITYEAAILADNAHIDLPALTAVLRAIGIEPRPKGQAPSGAPQASQNGRPPSNGNANRGGGGNYRGGQQRGGGGSWGGRGGGGGQRRQSANVAFEDIQDWFTCGHNISNVSENKFGSLQCNYRSNEWFDGSREWEGNDGIVYFCTAKEYRG